MAVQKLAVAITLQIIFVLAKDENITEEYEGRDVLNLENTLKLNDSNVRGFDSVKNDWMDLFLLSNTTFFPTSSATLMTQAFGSNKTTEEQIESIKEMANTITLAIQSEMANLLTYALSVCEKESGDDNNLKRKRRSTESPLDSTHLVLRLLKHIKANNEFQNIAIEKMMTAHEIAEKYGIHYTPDLDILSELVTSSNDETKGMISDLKNITGQNNVKFIPIKDNTSSVQNCPGNDIYYSYTIHNQTVENPTKCNSRPEKDYTSEFVRDKQKIMDRGHDRRAHETQVERSPYQRYSPLVSQRPSFYDSIAPHNFYPQPYCSLEPITIVLPCEEQFEHEPEIIAEETEEEVNSKTYLDYRNPGEVVVNNVITYTMSEKSHFKTPQIERLPQQIQYSFFLV